MKKNIEPMEQPMNANERFLYAIATRLNIIIEQNNSIIDALAKEKEIAVTSNKVVDKPIEVEKVEETQVQVEPKLKSPVRRTRKKVE